jgi:Amt family ammonium transporter
MVDCERAAHLFSDIRAMGVAIAIDDFGTGYSSLSTLRKLTFDKIKIDREFVTDVDRRKDGQAICQSVIALARGLGIQVLAEGVERPEEYAWLRRHGCSYFQGFFFSPPLEAAAFVAFAENPGGLAGKLASEARAMQADISERLSA